MVRAVLLIAGSSLVLQCNPAPGYQMPISPRTAPRRNAGCWCWVAGWRTEAGPSNVQHAGTQADTQSSYQLLSTNGNKWTAASVKLL